MKYLMIVFCGIALASCQTKQVDELSYTELQALKSDIGKRCEAQGVKQSSPEFQACFDQEARKEVSTRANAKERQRRAAQSVTCNTFGTSVVCF